LPAEIAARICFGRQRERVAHPAERRNRDGVEPGLVAEHRDGKVTERGAETGVHLGIDSRTMFEGGARRPAAGR